MTDDRVKIVLGYVTVLGLFLLALMFGLGKVEEKTSYGLVPIISILGTIATLWAQWAFGSKIKPPE